MSHSYNYYDPKNNALEKIKGTTKKKGFSESNNGRYLRTNL